MHIDCFFFVEKETPVIIEQKIQILTSANHCNINKFTKNPKNIQ